MKRSIIIEAIPRDGIVFYDSPFFHSVIKDAWDIFQQEQMSDRHWYKFVVTYINNLSRFEMVMHGIEDE